jgi:hypothetical integral membrane protein (TIGR02206 family)
VSTPVAYWIAVAIGTVICVSMCTACRRWPGAWVGWAGRAISVVLVVDAVLFVSVPVADGRWSVQASLPLALCDVALIVAAIACWWPQWNLAVELTYFWGLAGTLQAVVTPDLSSGFPRSSSSCSSWAISGSWSRPCSSWSASGCGHGLAR